MKKQLLRTMLAAVLLAIVSVSTWAHLNAQGSPNSAETATYASSELGFKGFNVAITADALSEAKAALQEAITKAAAANQILGDADLAAAITEAQAALNSDDLATIAAAAQNLKTVAKTAAKTALGKAIELANTFGVAQAAVAQYESLLTNDNASATDLAAALMALQNEAIPAAQAVLAQAKEFFATFNGTAATNLAAEFTALETALGGTDLDAITSAATALLTKAIPYAKDAMAKVFEYFAIIDDATLNADVAAAQAALTSNDIMAMVAAAKKIADDFPTAASTYVAMVNDMASQAKAAGTNGADALEAAVSTAMGILADENATIVQKGLAIRNLLRAVKAFEEANTPVEDAEKEAPTGWTNAITNGNLAGDDVSSFVVKDATQAQGPAVITAGAGKNGSRGIVVKSSERTWNDEDNKYNGEVWDTQFWIKFNVALPEGAKLHVEFDGKASKNASVSTQCHYNPGEYNHWTGIGALDFTTEWQTFSKDIVVDSDMAGTNGWLSIAFNLAEEPTATEYYFDNFGVWYQIPEPLLAEGNYYLYNVAAGGYMVGANTWGTRASISQLGGIEIEAKLNDGKYELKTEATYPGKLLGFNGYVDNGDANQYWTLNPVEGQEGVFTLTTNEGKVLSWDGGELTSTSVVDMPETAENAYWKFVTKEERMALFDNATPENPADATFLIINPDFSRNARTDVWADANLSIGGGNHINCNAEKWGGNTQTFDIKQQVTLPDGVYRVVWNGFYRYNNTTGNTNDVASTAHAAGTEVINSFVYLNEEDYPFTSIADEAAVAAYGKMPFSQAEASAAFGMGLYEQSAEVTVSGGTLTIGVKKIEHPGCDWTVWDNFRLFYLSSGETPAVTSEVTFDFNADTDHAVSSSSSNDGDIEGLEFIYYEGVTMVISEAEKGKTANRWWGTKNGPQVRMYSGTMTLEAPDDMAIVSVVVDNGKWNEGNTFNGVTAESGEWTGNSTNVVLAIAGNTQMNKVIVTLAAANDETTTYKAPVILVAPTFTPEPGTYTEPVTVEIDCRTAEAFIFYTTDGSTPDATSTLYDEPFTVSETTTVKAVAILFDEAGAPIETSDVVEATYTIEQQQEGEIFTLTLNGEEVSNPAGFFTHDTNGKFNFNNKFTGAEYDGISFTKGLKMEGTTKILFTTEETATVTIVQSTWSSNTIKFDDEELEIDKAAAGTECRIYTITNVAAGDHTITRGSGESGLFYVKVEYTGGEPTPVVTGIANVTAEQQKGEAYNLKGQKMSGKLQKGLYIINGKKIVIK